MSSPDNVRETLGRLKQRGGEPSPPGMAAHEGCLYLDALESAARGLPHHVARANARFAVAPAVPSHAHVLASRGVAYKEAAGEPLPDEDALHLVATYIAENPGVAGHAAFAAWLDATLGLDAAPAVAEASAATPAPAGVAAKRRGKAGKAKVDGAAAGPEAPPARKGKAAKGAAEGAAEGPLPGQADLPLDAAPRPPDLSGRRIRYRHEKAWVIGRVDEGGGAGALIRFTDEDGAPWSNVDRKRVEVLSEPAAEPEDAAPAAGASAGADVPTVLVVVPAKAARLAARRLAAGVDAAYDDFAVIRSFEATVGGYIVRVELTNGARADGDEPEVAPYVDIWVSGPDPEPGEAGATFALPPQPALLGTHAIRLGDADARLEIREDG